MTPGLKVSTSTLFKQTSSKRSGYVAPDQPRQEITITLPNGTEKKGTSWQTSPMDIAKEISKGLSERIVIAKVNGELWDLERPLEGSVSLELLDFEHPDGLSTFLFCASCRSPLQ